MIIKTKKPYQNKTWLKNQYIALQKGQREVARNCRVTDGTIHYWLKKFSILLRSRSEAEHLARANHVFLSGTAIEFLNGTLLGDGYLESRKWSASIQQTSKYKSYLEWFSRELTRYGIEQAGNIRRGPERFRNRKTGKWHSCDWYFYNSKSYVELKALHTKWYIKNPQPNNKPIHIKVIPLDLKLTPLAYRQWYIGDGTLNRNWKYIALYTQGFLKGDETFGRHDIDSLASKLLTIGINSARHKDGAIQISVKSTKVFLEYIGPCPVECYKYKWEV